MNIREAIMDFILTICENKKKVFTKNPDNVKNTLESLAYVVA